jgi:DNA polymerase-3 subunit chi
VTEVWFYHLQRETLEAALTPLLQKTLERGWRAVVRAGSAERVEALDQHLWTFREDSFLPHGRAEAGFAARQPVFLTTGAERPNGAEALFLTDGADPGPWTDLLVYGRVVLIFDGRDETALGEARRHWKDAKAAGFSVTYWQQTPEGRWEKRT